MMEMKMVMWLWVMLVLVGDCYGCLEQERIALLQIKHYINHPNGHSLPMWEEALVGEETTNCCEWEQVKCNDATGRVIQLSLNFTRSWQLGDWYLNASMFLPLEELESLDLSWNYLVGWFENEGFEKLAMLRNLEHLNLGANKFNNSILSTLGGLTSLKSLNLHYNKLNGTFYVDDLKGLKNLEELDIRDNELDSFVTHPGSDQKLAMLSNLDLSYNSFNRSILSTLGGLTSLKSLQLRGIGLNGTLYVDDLNGLKNLKELDISQNYDLDSFVTHPDFERVSVVEKIEVLDLGYNRFNSSILSSLGVLSSLKSLNLEYNGLRGSIQGRGLERLKHLEYLSLRGNYLNGSLPGQVWCELPDLQGLDLSESGFTGMVPLCLGNLTKIRLLDLSFNQFTGNLASSPLIHLTTLEYVFLSSNHFAIPVSLVPLFNHSKLKVLVGDNNRLIDQIDEFQRSIPRFQLQVLSLSNCRSDKSGIKLLHFLHYQHDLRVVDLSHNMFEGTLPIWLLENNTRLEVLVLRNDSLNGPFLLPSHPNPHVQSIDISENHFEGQLPTNISLIFPNLSDLNMSTNQFEGEIPTSLCDLDLLKFLDLSRNNLSGHIPEHLPIGLSSLWLLKLSYNNLSGQISPSFSNLTQLRYLFLDNNLFVGELPYSLATLSDLLMVDFSNNHLSGKLPRLMGNVSVLGFISLSSNHFEGLIPTEFCKFDWLEFLDLSENNLTGSIPSCFNSSRLVHVHLNKNRLRGPLIHAFYNSSSLVTLDLSDNNLTGRIPSWIGSLSVLSILLLKSNHFEGEIPIQMCQLKGLRILDLSQNFFYGPIPACFYDISSENYQKNNQDDPYALNLSTADMFESILVFFVNGLNLWLPHFYLNGDHTMVYLPQEAVLTTKHFSYSYKGDILIFMSGVDLSCNLLTGEIPPGIGNMGDIRALNLSHNNLTGSIPTTFSGLREIESLDLSYNSLNGSIPRQLIEMLHLAVFSVAHNNLSGKTPDRKAQFATFEESSYEGNPLLCGLPLHNSCTETVPTIQKDMDGDGEDGGFLDMEAFYVSFVVSYIIVLLVIVAVLFINPDWRRAWFHFIEVCMTSCYYFVLDSFTRLRKGRRV